MDGLLPIIRRARRPLLPPDDVAPVVPPAVVEPPPVVPPVEVLAGASPTAVAELAAAPVRRSRKERKRAETPAT